jgi:hypothetical protein
MEDLADRYHQYLERFAREIGGAVEVGKFAKHQGKLIKKLTFEEFSPILLEYLELCARYQESVERGDTINDVVLKVIREQAAQLVLKPPG